MATIKYRNPQTGEFEDIVIDGINDVPVDNKSYVRKNKLWEEITAESIGALTEHLDISDKENISNKVSSWSSTTTDAHYPSEKLVKTALDAKLNKITSSNKLAAANISGLATVATSGSYNDLNDAPVVSTFEIVQSPVETPDTTTYTKAETNNLMYPVGSIYLSVISTSPASIYGGTWEKLDDGYTLWSASNNGGSKIEAGLPNITGQFGFYVYGVGFIKAAGVGAFETSMYSGSSVNNFGVRTTEFNDNGINFKASRSNSIYGNSSTVQPPAIKVFMWKRIA